MRINVKRIYEKPTDRDGIRILVDRLWPRGVSKENAQLDFWFKNLGPSTELRKWFNHDPEKFTAFKKEYIKELQSGEQREALENLREVVQENKGKITLTFSAKNEKHNHVRLLQELLMNESD